MQNNDILTLDDIYFKDVFTQTDNGIDMEANRLKIVCITSSNDKFHLDSDGNLSVNSITTLENNQDLDKNLICDFIYPVGVIYLSVNNTNPSILFGGIWSEWGQGRVPVGVDTSQTEFNIVEKTGGSKYLQKHNHFVEDAGYTGGSAKDKVLFQNGMVHISNYIKTTEVGSGNSGNLQPYITCYMWKRIL